MPFYSCGTKVEHYPVHNPVTVDDKQYFENLVKLVEVSRTVSAEVSLEK